MFKVFFVLILLLLVFTNEEKVLAQGNFNDFPYEGAYITKEDSAILGFEFNHDAKTIKVLTQPSEKQTNRYMELINLLPNNMLLDTLLDPTTSSEQIEEIREKWDLNELDIAEIYLETADEIETWMPYNDVQELLAEKIPGLHSLMGNDYMITQPDIIQSQDLWIVNLLNMDRIFRFEMGEDTDSITDDYGVTYQLIEEGDSNE